MEDRNLSEVAQNPFAALFPSVEKAEKYRKQHGDAVTTLQTVDQHNADTVMQTQPLSVLLKDVQGIDSKNETEHGVVETLNNEKDRAWLVNDLLQRVFLITVDNDSGRVGNRQYGGLPKRCVYLRNTASDGEVPILQWINIDEAIMERLSMSHPRSHVMITGGARMTSLTAEIEAGEVANIKYLVSCYRRAFEECTKWKEKDANLFEMASRAKTLALSYAGTCLLSPEMFSKADPHKQLFQLLLNIQGDRVLAEFMDGIVQEHHERKDDLNSLFSPVLSMLAERAKDISSLLQSDLHTYINVLHLFAQHTGLAEILVSSKFWLPSKPPIGNIPGHAFEKQTLLGYFLGLTSMSKDPSKPSQFFQRPTEPSQGEIQATMSNLRRHLDDLSDKLHKVIIEIMKRSSLTKHQVLYWIGACLNGNIIRKKMVSQMFEFLATSQAEDGFFLNLSTLLLKMCQPFMDPCSPKLLKINPKYCAVNVSSEAIGKENTGLHLVGLDSETRLVIPPEEEHITLKVTPAFGFVTECFFMTHHCLHIGLWTVCEKYRKLMNELARLQQMYQEEGMLNERRKVQFENSIIKQLSLKTHLLNPSLIELALRFYIASASWLNQVALAGDDFEEMTCFKEVEIPLPTQTPTGLLFIPEYVVETMADFIIFLRHFSEDTLESAGRSLHHLVTFFVIYMGSPERVRNPHLRAKLAETLEALVPIQKSQNSSGLLSATSINMFNRQNAFLQHKFAPAYLPQALLQLFVDIEFTGHAMQFEQKFGYRHHMYSVLQYMWKQDNYKDTLFKLADEAANIQKNSITVQIPIFLRFLNLLINDSIYLLDEALQFMATLKKLQAEKDSGEWESLNEQAQQQKEQELQHTGGMARSHNILANETVRALSYMTAEIKRPFLIGCILRRIADMLNYFLLRLVGPKMGELKVKNLSEFHFKPQQLVSDIVDIYLNLGEDESFCHAVATDKRSYSPNLFKQSERVLKLIGRPSSVIFRLSELAHRVEECAQQEEEAEDLPEPPDEFVDPITSTLMTDPVILPTSNNVVDMSTICRHLLSDQKDPFNRSPLTLEMVQKHVELRERIQQWLAEVKAQKKS